MWKNAHQIEENDKMRDYRELVARMLGKGSPIVSKKFCGACEWGMTLISKSHCTLFDAEVKRQPGTQGFERCAECFDLMREETDQWRRKSQRTKDDNDIGEE